MNTEETTQKPPRFFLMIGWSWFVMGLIGVLLGLLSLPSLFQTEQLKELINRPPFQSVPGFEDMFDELLGYYVPFTIAQIILSILAVWAGWFFLKRRNSGRYMLSALNVVSMGCLVWAVWLILDLFHGLSRSLGLPQLVEAGLVRNIPLIVNSYMWGSLVVLVIPLLWMAWYFHSPKIRAYFNSV